MPLPVLSQSIVGKVDELCNPAFNKQKNGDLAGALYEFNRLIQIFPNFATPYSGRGLVKKDMGDIAGAMADYNRAIQLDPKHASAYGNRGVLKAKNQDLDGAIADFSRAIEFAPADVIGPRQPRQGKTG